MNNSPAPKTAASSSAKSSKSKQRGLFKTSLCQYFVANGKCQFGNRCIYAHGPDDLRVHPTNRSKTMKKESLPQSKDMNFLYKTSLCRSFMSDGICLFGARCLFAHGYSELKPKPEGNVSIAPSSTAVDEKPLQKMQSLSSSSSSGKQKNSKAFRQTQTKRISMLSATKKTHEWTTKNTDDSASRIRKGHHIVRAMPSSVSNVHEDHCNKDEDSRHERLPLVDQERIAVHDA